MRGTFFLFIILCVATIFIGDCTRASENVTGENLIDACGSVPGIPSIKPVTENTFNAIGRYRVEIADWIGCGAHNVKSERDLKLINKVRFTSDKWTILGLQEIQRARREKINNPDPDPELASEPDKPRNRRPASGS